MKTLKSLIREELKNINTINILLKKTPIDTTSIDISGIIITKLPSKIMNFKNLEELFAKNCGLIELPYNIGDLNNLKILSLPDNYITSLPESIGKLKNLEVINLSKNDIKNIPDSISNLDKTIIDFSLDKTIDQHLKKRLRKLLPSIDIRYNIDRYNAFNPQNKRHYQ